MNDRSALVRSLSAVLVLSACAGPAPTTTRIAAATGGSVTGTAHHVVIPAMALAADTEVTLETVSADAYPALPGSLPDVLLIRPEGTVLEHPAAVTIESSFIGAAAGERISVSQLVDVDGVTRWSPIESSVDTATGDVTLSVTRFAPIAVVVTAATSAGGIEGTMEWGDGSPAAAAPVQLFRGTTALTTVMTDATGAFTFGDLEPGAYRLVVDYECMLDQAVTVTAGTITRQDLVICGT